MIITISKNCLFPIQIRPYFSLKSGVKGAFGVGYRRFKNLISFFNSMQGMGGSFKTFFQQKIW